jgi:hypothetical protein
MLIAFANWLQRPMVLLWLAYFAILEILSWGTSSWPSGPCLISPDQNQYPTNNNDQHSCPTFFIGSLIILGRFDRFIGDHDKSIVAVFTIVLAISTIGLWISTKSVAIAGKAAADHIPLVERAYIFCGPLADPDGLKIDASGSPFIRVEVGNYGQTPGILKTVYGEWSLLATASNVPVYQHGDSAPFDVVIARAETKAVPLTFQGPPLSLAGWAYFFGYIEYVDIFKITRRSRFRLIVTRDGKWRPDGPPAWNDWD